ncbi:MAG: pseudaminic acid cytidylyltransferase [Verrucomicrobiota bacterium]
MSSICIIPARGGSKRIPDKNIRDFSGRPVISYSIQAALDSSLFDQVIVSTDSPQIAEVARREGAESIAGRPKNLSTDEVSLADVLKHEASSRINQGIENICFLLATAPFLSAARISEGYRVMEEGKWDYVIAAAEFSAPVLRAFEQLPDGGTKMIFEDAYYQHSNEMASVYHDAGQMYWGKTEKWANPTPGFFGKKTTLIEVPRLEAQDIDTEEDWKAAELLFELLRIRK